ncbi:MAG: xylose isomerase [Rhodoglobus sp.]|nr:xylose isomerase [Rhodoglobus sp.]
MSEIEWTLSGFGDEIHVDPVVQIAVLQALGANHIEVRRAWGINIVDMADDDLGRLAALFAENGMGVSAIASPIGKVDVSSPPEDEVERLRRAINAAQRLGSRYVRIFSFYPGEGVPPESVRDAVMVRMRAFADLAEREHVVLLHENEKHIFGDTPDRVVDIMESVGSDALKVAWDAANFVQVGVKPFTEAYSLVRPYVEYLQVKDAIAATGQVVAAGEGDGEVQETMNAFRDDGYRGFVSLEPHMAEAYELGGFSGPKAFGIAARALARVLDKAGVKSV